MKVNECYRYMWTKTVTYPGGREHMIVGPVPGDVETAAQKMDGYLPITYVVEHASHSHRAGSRSAGHGFARAA